MTDNATILDTQTHALTERNATLLIAVYCCTSDRHQSKFARRQRPQSSRTLSAQSTSPSQSLFSPSVQDASAAGTGSHVKISTKQVPLQRSAEGPVTDRERVPPSAINEKSCSHKRCRRRCTPPGDSSWSTCRRCSSTGSHDTEPGAEPSPRHRSHAANYSGCVQKRTIKTYRNTCSACTNLLSLHGVL